ncbi:MAG: D-glycerate dehydrogenase [Planctomycetota bacterium]|nr:D-glycerate dehydrogenase [Planctomycetota bacterium]
MPHEPDHRAADLREGGQVRIVADGPLPAAIRKLLGKHVEILPWTVATAGSPLPIEGMYTYDRPRVDGRMLDRLPGVKVISNNGVGVDHINVRDAVARGIPVGNTPGIPAGATADLGFALILAAARRVTEGDRFSRRPDVTVFDPGDLVGREVYGQTLGIIGLGQIGAEVARRARGFDMTVVYHNRQRRTDVEPLLEARYVSFSELLEISDFVVLSVPLTEQTQGMIDSDALAQMKSTATLVNIARGAVVDTAALTAALQQGDIHSAALDVTEPEPLPRDHPLLTMDNVTITPHLGTASAQTRQRMNEISVENLLRGIRGQPLLFEVKPASR